MASPAPSVTSTERSPVYASLADLRDRLADLEARVRAAVELRRRGDPDPDDRFRGLYISDAQVDELLSGAGNGDGGHAEPATAIAPLPHSSRRSSTSASPRRDVDGSRLRRLASHFGLDETDLGTSSSRSRLTSNHASSACTHICRTMSPDGGRASAWPSSCADSPHGPSRHATVSPLPVHWSLAGFSGWKTPIDRC